MDDKDNFNMVRLDDVLEVIHTVDGVEAYSVSFEKDEDFPILAHKLRELLKHATNHSMRKGRSQVQREITRALGLSFGPN